MQIDISVDFYKVDAAFQKLRKVIQRDFKKELEIWREAAEPVVDEIKALVPVGTENKFLYDNGLRKNKDGSYSIHLSKVSKKGPFTPGTLKDSIMILPNIKNAVVIGSYTRGYNSFRQLYALHFFMLEYGFSPAGGPTFVQGFGFMRKGAINGANACLRIMAKGYIKLLQDQIKEVERG